MQDLRSILFSGVVTSPLILKNGQPFRRGVRFYNLHAYESADGVQWQVTPGSGEPFSALTKLPDGSLIAVGNSGNIWKRTPMDPPSVLPLAIEAVRYDPDKHSVTLDVTGTRGRDYVVEVSRDLAAWEGIQSVTADGARFSIKVDAPTGATTAYFRVAESKRPPGISP